LTGVDGQAEFRGKRLLLVDDEERILSALRRSLRREGYEILVAATVDRALEILQHEPIDLILSDHMMPGMTGIELLGEARRRQPEAVRMLISGWSQAVSAEELEELGVAVLVSKPWDDSELKQAIRKLLA
jgi:response regulator RpfG family c-di-GMP phosphodiesterase